MSCHVMCQVNKLEFGYPGCESLYSEVDFGVDLDSRIALVGPNGAGACRVVSVSCRVVSCLHSFIASLCCGSSLRPEDSDIT